MRRPDLRAARYYSPGFDPFCGECGNAYVRHVSTRAMSRKIARVGPQREAAMMVEILSRPGAIPWTCDRCGNFGVSVVVVEDDGMDSIPSS